jgi:hypothetical protein
MRTLANPQDLDAVLHRISSLTITDRALWGSMTPHAMMCHLSDSYCLGLGRVNANPASGVFQRTFVKQIALYAPLKWPKNIKTIPEVEQGRGGTLPIEFEQDRARLLTVTQQFAASSCLAAQMHPIFNAMSQKDWLRWGYLHADHHLRQFGR